MDTSVDVERMTIWTTFSDSLHTAIQTKLEHPQPYWTRPCDGISRCYCFRLRHDTQNTSKHFLIETAAIVFIFMCVYTAKATWTKKKSDDNNWCAFYCTLSEIRTGMLDLNWEFSKGLLARWIYIKSLFPLFFQFSFLRVRTFNHAKTENIKFNRAIPLFPFDANNETASNNKLQHR